MAESCKEADREAAWGGDLSNFRELIGLRGLPFPGDRLRRSGGAKRRGNQTDRPENECIHFQAGLLISSARELSWRHRPNWRRLFVLRPEAGSPEWVQGLRAPGKPALGLVFSEKRAGRPRIQAGPGAELEAAEASNVPLAALHFHTSYTILKLKPYHL